MKVIDNTADLDNYCSLWSQYPFITIDLEFLREHSYYAQLCLIQIGSTAECAIIDPLAPDLDMSSFFELLQNNAVLKVFHSGRQDLEILYYLTGKIPTPIFDTQVAGMVTGFGESASYEYLVKSILEISLDKTSRLSDWSHRPLNKTQLEYALADVTHLVHVYEFLRDKLKELDRESWIEDEMSVITNPATYVINPEEAWMRIKHRSHNARFLTLLRELACWRETRSQLRNTPRQSFLKDDMLLTIAATCPQDKDELTCIRNIRKDVAAGKLGDEIISVIQNFAEINEADYIVPPKDKTISNTSSPLYELLKMLLRICSQSEGVVSRLIASDEDLKAFSHFSDKNNPILKGWRLKIFGTQALELRKGNLCIAYNPQSHQIDLTPKAS